MKRLVFLGVFGFFFAGCAGMMEMARDEVCHEEGAYQQGMNDAREGKRMNFGFAQICHRETKALAMKGYKEGYEAGSLVPTDTTVTVNIGQAQAAPKKFFCEVTAFTDTFSGWGASELEAKINAKNKCALKHNKMHCGEIVCEGDQSDHL